VRPRNDRIQEHQFLPGVRLGFQVDDEKPQRNIDLVGGQTDALRRVHQVEHPSHGLAQREVDARDVARFPAQGGMRILHDFHDRRIIGDHCARKQALPRAGGVSAW
jgi:hypothetical protein